MSYPVPVTSLLTGLKEDRLDTFPMKLTGLSHFCLCSTTENAIKWFNFLSKVSPFIISKFTRDLNNVCKYWDTQHHYFSACPKWKMMVVRCPSI